MVTLAVIMCIWFIISYYRLNKISKKEDESFNPAAGTIFDSFGFFLGGSTIALALVILIIKYFP